MYSVPELSRDEVHFEGATVVADILRNEYRLPNVLFSSPPSMCAWEPIRKVEASGPHFKVALYKAHHVVLRTGDEVASGNMVLTDIRNEYTGILPFVTVLEHDDVWINDFALWVLKLDSITHQTCLPPPLQGQWPLWLAWPGELAHECASSAPGTSEGDPGS